MDLDLVIMLTNLIKLEWPGKLLTICKLFVRALLPLDFSLGLLDLIVILTLVLERRSNRQLNSSGVNVRLLSSIELEVLHDLTRHYNPSNIVLEIRI